MDACAGGCLDSGCKHGSIPLPTDQFSRPLVGSDNKPLEDIVRKGSAAVLDFVSIKELEIGQYRPYSKDD